jgi:arylamine N-acetyltransferase
LRAFADLAAVVHHDRHRHERTVAGLPEARLQHKMIAGKRGGYCFEQNMLFRAGLRSLGYKITSLQERVVRGLAIDALRPAIHMLSKVELPEGTILRMSTSASVGTSHQRREAIVELPPSIPSCLRA